MFTSFSTDACSLLESLLIRFSNRKFEDLAKSCPDEVMGCIRGFPFLETHKEVDEFIKWCENSEHKKVQGIS